VGGVPKKVKIAGYGFLKKGWPSSDQYYHLFMSEIIPTNFLPYPASLQSLLDCLLFVIYVKVTRVNNLRLDKNRHYHYICT
jgi:hypothetical protein